MSLLLLLSTFSLFLNAQTKKVAIGSVNGTTASVTDVTLAENVLKANLPAGAFVSDVRLEYSGYDAKYYLTGVVTNAKVSAIGIQVQQTNNTLYAAAGPGVQITCSGRNCSVCRLIISGWKPRCKCEESTNPDWACDMTQTATISIP